VGDERALGVVRLGDVDDELGDGGVEVAEG
jgi:hypothetical protein